MIKTAVAIFNSWASAPVVCLESNSVISAISSWICPFRIFSASIRVFSITFVSKKKSPAPEVVAKTTPETYFFKKKWPAPGNSRADKRAAFIALFIQYIPVVRRHLDVRHSELKTEASAGRRWSIHLESFIAAAAATPQIQLKNKTKRGASNPSSKPAIPLWALRGKITNSWIAVGARLSRAPLV